MKLRMFKRVVLVPAIAGLAVIASAVSLAHPGGGGNGGFGGHEMHPKKQIMKMMRKLDLTMEQKLSVRSTLSDTRDQASVFKDDLKKMRSDVFALIKSGNVTQQSINALLDQYESSLRGMSKTGANTRNAIYSILTDQQREKARELMEKRQARAENRDPQQRLNKVAEKLEFSDAQLASATELLPDMMEARTALRDTLKSYREAQRDLMVNNNLSDAELDALFDQHFPAFKTNLLTAIQAHEQMYQLLTDEQKEKIKGKRARMFMPGMI